ncbi:MAG: hypothetical protein AAGJ46_16950 [Planctomycetota bacterium]
MSILKSKSIKTKRRRLKQKMKPFADRRLDSQTAVLAAAVTLGAAGCGLGALAGDYLSDRFGLAGFAFSAVAPLLALAALVAWTADWMRRSRERNHLLCSVCGADVIGGYSSVGPGAAAQIEAIRRKHPGWKSHEETPARCYRCGAFIEEYLAAEIQDPDTPTP